MGKIKSSKAPKLLYKFYKFNSESLDCLVADYLWFSNADYLNDPFEFNAPFKKSGYGAEDMSKFLKLVRQEDGVEGVKDFKKQYPDWKTNPSILDSYLSKKLKRIKKTAEKMAVCCFTTSFDNPVMLAHYCDNYTGFIVEYHASALTDVGNFMKVNYYPRGKEMNLVDEFYKNPKFSTLAFKRKEWTYESEYRLLATSAKNHLKAGFRLDVKPYAYSKIIVPAKAPDSVKRTLFAISQGFDPVVPLYECYADSAIEFKLRELPKSELPVKDVMV